MGKIILYMAISADGFIAGKHDETPWSDEEWVAFQAFVKSCDAALLGRRTYEIMKEGGEFVDRATYIVATSDPSMDTNGFQKTIIQNKNDVPDVNKLGVIGGGELNGRLAELGVIDEIILDIEPVILGEGKRLFGTHAVQLQLSLISSRKIGTGTIQNHYKVLS